jgi:hypothetical protein
MGPQEEPPVEPDLDQTPPPRGRAGRVGSAFLGEQDIEELPLEPEEPEADPPPPEDDPPKPKPKRGPLGGAFGV